MPKPHIIPLRQVAAWDFPALGAGGEIRAEVPALQRGLVWSPQQVEFLWDSILRGFPVGSLVVCPCVEAQRSGVAGRPTHHLLDGQQRGNAIALGFQDPFPPGGSEAVAGIRGNVAQAILWLDLAPLGSRRRAINRIGQKSTRRFLARVTTLSHPWGYESDDAAGRLNAGEQRACAEHAGGRSRDAASTRRPLPTELFPWKSNAPVPLGWLMAEIEREPDDAQSFWERVKGRLERERAAEKRHWVELARDFLEQGDESMRRQQEDVFQAMRRARDTRMVVLEMPKEVLDAPHPAFAESPSGAAVGNVEQLFNRLNRQGTALDGDELAFSMIKAYWPGAGRAVARVANPRFPQARLASLAVRVALTEAGDEQLARKLGVSQIRGRAVATAGTKEHEERLKIEAVLGLSDEGDERGAARLGNICGTVDEWLVYGAEAPVGLPPVLVSSVARGSEDIYLFLMHLADRLHAEGNGGGRDVAWRRLLPGVATLAHWFAREDRDKPKIGDCLMRSIVREATPAAVAEGARQAITEGLIVSPCAPEELEEWLRLPDAVPPAAELREWRFESAFGRTAEQRPSNWERVINRTCWQKELLLHAQRASLAEWFPSYDPSRQDMWAEHNRPWDIDHLYPAGFVHDKRGENRGEFIGLCQEWINCIGNLRAWPFEMNRSDQDKPARDKIRSEDMASSLVVSKEELEQFSHEDRARKEAQAAGELCRAIRGRYLRIYRAWYESAGIGRIGIGKVPDTV